MDPTTKGYDTDLIVVTHPRINDSLLPTQNRRRTPPAHRRVWMSISQTAFVHLPQPLATPSSSCNCSSEVTPLRIAARTSRSETDWQTQRIMTESSSEFEQESFSLKRGQDATGFVNAASDCEGVFGILTHSTCAWIPNKAGSKRCCGWPSPVE